MARYVLINSQTTSVSPIITEPGNVPLGWRSEKLFVLAAKVRWVFVAHTEPGTCRVQVFAQHQTASFLQSYLFLKLQWAHRRHGLEVMMEA